MTANSTRTVLSIDFGTSKSLAALFDGDHFEMVTDPNSGLFAVPPSLFVDGSGSVLVGAVADRLHQSEPRRYVSELKRTLTQPGNVSLGDWTATRVEMVGRVLDFLRERADQQSQERHYQAVLTVPAAYDKFRQALMKQAGAKAGLEVDLLSEPVAAAMAAQGPPGAADGTHILVYDLGADTFDSAVVTARGAGFEVDGHSSLPHRGGLYFEQRIYDRLVELTPNAAARAALTGKDESVQALQARLMLRDECRQVKHALSETTSVSNMTFAIDPPLSYTVTRQWFEEAIGALVKSTIDCCEALLGSCALFASDIDHVLLVGGSSQVPLVRRLVETTLGRPVTQPGDLELAVAQGAARWGWLARQRQAELERWAYDWEQARRQDDYLMRGESLAAAKQWRADNPRHVEPPLAKEFLDLSTTKNQRSSLKVFLCHSSSDKPTVRMLYSRLRSEDMQPWLDEEDILPGQDWDSEIRKAIHASDVVLVCLSRNSVNKVGYLQKEIRSVLDVADEQPPGTIFLIPARLEPLDVPDRFQRWQWVDLFRESGYERLVRALRARAARTSSSGTAPASSRTQDERRDLFTRQMPDSPAVGSGKDRSTVDKSWSWDRLVLSEAIEKELRQLLMLLEKPERAAAFGIETPSGVLLVGPPGTGKTTIARVLAAESHCSFYPVAPRDLTSKWVGESEAKVARLFAQARDDAPSIVFLDEIDALCAAPAGSGGGWGVSQLIAEIDMLPGQAWVLVVGATNRPDLLDPGLVWRLSRTLQIGLPDLPARGRLFELFTARMPLARVNLDQLAERTNGLSGADLEALCQQAAMVALTRAALETGERRETVTTTDFETALATLQQSQQSLARPLQNPSMARFLNDLGRVGE